MDFENVSIIGLSFVDGPRRVTSEELEQRLSPVLKRFGIREKLLRELTGIFARRHWPDEVLPSEVATEAARLAIEDAGMTLIPLHQLPEVPRPDE